MTKSTTQRWIYLFLLAVIAIITTTLYTGSFGQAQNKDDNEAAEKAAILKRVISFALHEDDPAPNLEISNPNPQMKKGDSLQLSLADSNGNKVSGVTWYVVTRFPDDKIFTAEESQTAPDSHASVTTDGLVKVKDDEGAIIVAKYGKYLHLSTISVLDKAKADKANKQANIKTEVAKIVDLASRLEKDEDKILFVHDYLVQNISYTSAPNDDATEELYAALKEKKGRMHRLCKIRSR